MRCVVGSVKPGQTGSSQSTSVFLTVLFQQCFIIIFHSSTTDTVRIMLVTGIVAKENISLLTELSVYLYWAMGWTAEKARHNFRHEEEIIFSKASIPVLGPTQPFCIMGIGVFFPQGKTSRSQSWSLTSI